MFIKQISVFLENKRGSFRMLTELLGKNGIEEEGDHQTPLAKKGIYYRLWNGLVSGQTL